MSESSNLPARVAPPAVLAEIIEKKQQLAVAIPETCRSRMEVARILQGLGIAVARDPKLANCTPRSAYIATMTALRLGLDPSGIGGQAWLVPFKDEATLIVGWRGKAELLRRTGLVLGGGISTGAVYDADEFDFGTDADRGTFLRHRPCLRGDPGQVLGYFALARFTDGSSEAEFISAAEVDRIRRASKAPDSPAWKNWYDEMGRRSAFSRLSKRLPWSADLAEVEAMEAPIHEPETAPALPSARTAQAVAARVLAAPVVEPEPVQESDDDQDPFAADPPRAAAPLPGEPATLAERVHTAIAGMGENAAATALRKVGLSVLPSAATLAGWPPAKLAVLARNAGVTP